jgi:hypothetical protein
MRWHEDGTMKRRAVAHLLATAPAASFLRGAADHA